MPLDLRNVPPNRFPAFDLAGILFGHAAAHIVSAIPLEPAAWILGVDPSFLSPGRQRLTRIYSEMIEGAVAARRRKPCTRKPVSREFLAAVCHVLAAKYPESEHFLWRQFRTKFGIEIAAHRCAANITIFPLHLVVNGNDIVPLFAHDNPSAR